MRLSDDEVVTLEHIIRLAYAEMEQTVWEASPEALSELVVLGLNGRGVVGAPPESCALLALVLEVKQARAAAARAKP